MNFQTISNSLGTFDDSLGLSLAYLRAKKFSEAIETQKKLTPEEFLGVVKYFLLLAFLPTISSNI